MLRSSSVILTAGSASWKKNLLLLSPVLVIGLTSLTARAIGQQLGDWSWVPVFLVYWILLTLLLVWGAGWGTYKRWVRPSQGAWGWRLLPLITLALFTPTFLLNWSALNSWGIALPWLILALVDPWLEEGYWRGLLMAVTDGWPTWLAILYTTLWFGLSHPLILGVNVPALRGLPGFLGTVFTGLVWTLSYERTRSLRWPLFTHFLVDLASVSVLVFTGKAIFPH